jgi:hypothetical protein
MKFMNFTAYIDESDTHGPTPDVVMSAMLSTEGRWERCSRDFERIRQRFGFSIFHATEFRASRGEFQGWGAAKMSDLYIAIGKLGETISTNALPSRFRTTFTGSVF